MLRIVKLLDNISKPVLLAIGLSTAILIGVLQYFTGPQISFSILYLFPILIITWFAGRSAGIAVAIASIVSWLASDLTFASCFSNPGIPYLNEAFRLIVFIMIVWVVSKLKDTVELKEKLAMTDFLTGVGNNRAFTIEADAEIKRAKDSELTFSAAYLDIDDFKLINDNLGHSTGDAVLRKVAQIINENTRKSDILARFGGDEFVMLFPETSDVAALNIAKKLQTALIASMNENNWPVTFSIGLVTFNVIPDTVDGILKVADSQMYASKQNGKNMIKHKTI